MGASSSSIQHAVTVYASAGSVSPPAECPAHKSKGADAPPPPECPAHKTKAVPSECPVNHGASLSECPASIDLRQSAVPENDIDPANMVRFKLEF
jgi:hypothetical protein